MSQPIVSASDNRQNTPTSTAATTPRPAEVASRPSEVISGIAQERFWSDRTEKKCTAV